MSTDVNPENVTPAASAAQQFAAKRKERETGHELTLPSGVVVLVSRPSIRKMLTSGEIPNDVASELQRAAPSAVAGNTPNIDFTKSMKFSEILVTKALQSPKIVDAPNYDNDEISFDDIEDGDVNAIVEFVQGDVKDTASFPSK
jgi:hypothetical protein